jgi:hypothetical protein
MELPSLRTILTGLLKDLEVEEKLQVNKEAEETQDAPLTSSTTISSLPQRAQNALLALHHIFPAVLLSSLDLIDNSLVTRYRLPSAGDGAIHTSPPVYYVPSSQARSRTQTQRTRAVYEVRPGAWHCTCPSYAFSAFSSRSSFDPYEQETDDHHDSERWGGQLRGGQLPICKHLLAVVIGEKLGMIPEKEVDMHTLAGYAYGEA